MQDSAKSAWIGDEEVVFQLDLEPEHGTTAWFAQHHINVLFWPTSSPDLNPIENLWGIVKRKVASLHLGNQAELKTLLKQPGLLLHLHSVITYTVIAFKPWPT